MNKNKKLHIRNLIILIIIIILIGVGIAITMSRYRSEAETSLNAEIAFYVVEDTYQEENIFLKDLYPRTNSFDYVFTVANTDGTNTAETSIEYTVELEATTNLPLEFKIYKASNVLDDPSDVTSELTLDYSQVTGTNNIDNYITLDNTGETYIRKIKIKTGNFTHGQTKLDTYKIAVTFPIGYAEYEEYEGMIDNINIKLQAKQKTD